MHYPRISFAGDRYDCIGWIMTSNRWEYYILSVEDVPDGCFFAYVMGFESELGYVSWDETSPHIRLRLEGEALIKEVAERTLLPPENMSWEAPFPPVS